MKFNKTHGQLAQGVKFTMIESFTFPYIARAPFPSKVTVFENNSHLSFTASRIAPCEECFPGIRGFDKQWRIKKNILYITKRGKKTRQPQTLTGLCVRICGANQLTLVKWGGVKCLLTLGSHHTLSINSHRRAQHRPAHTAWNKRGVKVRQCSYWCVRLAC